MSNMSYCRFQNTSDDLEDCVEALEEDPKLANLRGDELRCAIRLIEMCRNVADQFEEVNLTDLWKDHK
jgi:hypothetical protein